MLFRRGIILSSLAPTSLVNQFTTEELLNNTINYAPGVPRLGIPNYQWWTEALHGIAKSPGVNFDLSDPHAEFSSATQFPQTINLGATFDDDLYQQIARVIASEVRAYNNAGKAGLNLSSPLNINCFRDPRWGRGQETVGEDPLHMSRFAVRMVHGLQGPHAQNEAEGNKLTVAATCKHYLAYDLGQYDGGERYQFDAIVSKQDLSDFHLPQFRAQAWGLDKTHNYVTSDCDAVANVYDGHRYAQNYVEAAAKSINAGTDLDCGATYSENLGAALKQKLADIATIRRAVTRMYASLVRLGYFDDPASQPLTLPIKQKPTKIAIIGPYTNVSTSFRGNYAGPAAFNMTMVDAASRVFPDAKIVWVNGTDISGPYIPSDAQNAVKLASDADSLRLIHDLSQSRKKDKKSKLVVVQFGGGQLDGASLKSDDGVGALVWAGYPGQSASLAVWDILVGKAVPAGRLPVTQYPASYIDDLPESAMSLRPKAGYPGRTYKWYNGVPTYPFGHGLHYTTFSASLAKIQPYAIPTTPAAKGPEGVHAEHISVADVQANIKNTGKVASDYTALLFARHSNGPAPYPRKTLVGYTKAKNLSAGEERSVTIKITQAALARADEEGNQFLYPGSYQLELDTEEHRLASTILVLTGKAANVIPWVSGDMS
ncbi:related to Beta-xylosidase [Ustilago sp. UG-2017b]|nr:related to Beta-xylosidase [Ustilago sp. UG-2017b]